MSLLAMQLSGFLPNGSAVGGSEFELLVTEAVCVSIPYLSVVSSIDTVEYCRELDEYVRYVYDLRKSLFPIDVKRLFVGNSRPLLEMIRGSLCWWSN